MRPEARGRHSRAAGFASRVSRGSAAAAVNRTGTLPDTGKFPSESAHSRAVRGLSAYRPHTARPWSARGGVEEAWPSESRRKGGGVSFRSAGGARPPVGRPIVLPRWSRYVIPVLGSVVVLIVLISVGAGIWTDFLCVRSVGYTSVFDTTYGVTLALFAITAFFMMAVIGANIRIAYRLRPAHRPISPQPQGPHSSRRGFNPLSLSMVRRSPRVNGP